MMFWSRRREATLAPIIPARGGAMVHCLQLIIIDVAIPLAAPVTGGRVCSIGSALSSQLVSFCWLWLHLWSVSDMFGLRFRGRLGRAQQRCQALKGLRTILGLVFLGPKVLVLIQGVFLVLRT